MAEITFEPSLESTLKDKVVVLTGGAAGIGCAAVKYFHGLGAKVVFGDVNDAAGHQLESELNSAGAKYIHCDTSKYADQLAMFAMAHENFGRVDIVVANAGMCIPEDAFAAGQDISKEPSMKELDVNLKGELFTARIGLHYLRQSGGGDLILVSSVAGFKEAAGLTPYLASKHGIIGVLRGLRMSVINENIRVNVICPWMTRTSIAEPIREVWDAQGFPANDPEDVVRGMAVCSTANRSEGGKNHTGAKLPFNGKTIYVAGGKLYEIEDRIQELEPDWLGAKNSRELTEGHAFLAKLASGH